MSTFELDLESILKATRAISGVHQKDELVRTFLSIAMESAGGNRAVYLRPSKGQGWEVDAQCQLEEETGKPIFQYGYGYVLPTQGMSAPAPGTVLGFVRESGKSLVLDSRDLPAHFSRDPYFQGKELSILCIPILLHGQFHSMLYMENSMAAGVFNTGRLRLLDILVTEVSIALENVRLYEELEERVTERTAELAYSNEQLLESNQELERFAYVVSHDLQTPIWGVAANAQFLSEDFGGAHEEADHYMQQIIQSCTRMQEMIKDVLAYSKFGTKNVAGLEPVQLKDVFQSAVDILGPTIEGSRAQVTCGVLPVVMGVPAQLSQLFQNLLGNGLKYHADDRPKVNVKAKQDGKMWVISTQDNGIGIAPEYQDTIFEIFKRLHTQKDYPGTGIGLALCKKIVEHHGGKIWVESETGKGSTFHFTLQGADDGK